MPDATPRPHIPLQRRQLVRIAATAAATAFAAGYIVSEVATDAEVLTWLARAAASVAAVTLFVSIMEVRLARQMARSDANTQQHLAELERRLDSWMKDARYATGYVDGLQRRPPDGDGGRHLRSV